MNYVHPTETAGDGKRVHVRTKMRQDPLDDRIRCAQCGYFFKESRDSKGSTENSPGIEITDTVVAVNIPANQMPALLQNVATFQATSVTVKEPMVRGGCPLCGTFNPKGVGRNDDFEKGRDLSNR